MPQTAVFARLRAYLELTKPRISLLLLAVAVLAYVVASRGAGSLRGVITTVMAVGLLAAGVFALNHWAERDRDALMARTRRRPLPSGGLVPEEALVFGLSMVSISLVFSTLAANLLTGLIALFVAVTYVLLYTPLKYRTMYHTAVGALSGATPPLMGWAVATGGLAADAWILFGVLLFWQFPHLLSIEMMYRDDYLRAGVRVLPEGRAGALLVLSTQVLLVATSILPVLSGLAGPLYGVGAFLLGAGFLAVGAHVVMGHRRLAPRHLLRASVVYLPALFLLLAVGS